MFHLETEFFAWDFMAWAINFLLAALLVAAAVFALGGKLKLTLTESEGCGQEEMEHYVPIFERYLKLFRTRAVDIWSGYAWLLALSPIFLLLLFLSAVHSG